MSLSLSRKSHIVSLPYGSPVSLQVFLCVLDKNGNQLEESLEDALDCVNDNIENLSLLTDFPIGIFWHLVTVHISVTFLFSHENLTLNLKN